jgi:hypothetical protein
MIPPSPLLSARMMSVMYLSNTITIGAQKMVEMPPSIFSVWRRIPYSGLKVSLTAYRASADIAVDDAKGSKRERRPVLLRMRIIGHLPMLTEERHKGYSSVVSKLVAAKKIAS